MSSRASKEYRYEKLTWPEICDAIDAGQVCIVPCGAVEQHGPHLPLDVDVLCSTQVALGAAARTPANCLVLPTVNFGYTGHVIDFPGTINNDFEHFIHHVLDIAKSLAYHGFKKIVLLNGHGSNMPNLDLAARRANLETDAECVLMAWWNLLTVDKDFMPGWRESKFPGGCSHAGELETSMYLYLDRENVREDLIESGTISFNDEDSPFHYIDLFAQARARWSPGPAAIPKRGSSATPGWRAWKRANGPTRRPSASSSDSSSGSRKGPGIRGAKGIAALRRCRLPGDRRACDCGGRMVACCCSRGRARAGRGRPQRAGKRRNLCAVFPIISSFSASLREGSSSRTTVVRGPYPGSSQIQGKSLAHIRRRGP